MDISTAFIISRYDTIVVGKKQKEIEVNMRKGDKTREVYLYR